MWTLGTINCWLPYSAKFSRCIIFTVFADSSGTVKIKLLKTFQLKCSRVRGVWSGNITIAIPLLHCVDVKGNMALDCYFKANATRWFLEARFRIKVPSTSIAFVNGEASLATKKALDDVCPWTKRLDLEASSWAWQQIVHVAAKNGCG